MKYLVVFMCLHAFIYICMSGFLHSTHKNDLHVVLCHKWCLCTSPPPPINWERQKHEHRLNLIPIETPISDAHANLPLLKISVP